MIAHTNWRRFVSIAAMLIVALLSLDVSAAVAQDDDSSPARKLIVGVKQSPPFAFKDSDDHWTGISIELWRYLMDELNLDYELQECTLEEMFIGLGNGDLHAAVAAISVTAPRTQVADFCHPHYSTGLGIAVSSESGSGFWSSIRRVVSARLLLIVGGMISFVILCGLSFWLMERKVNENMFGGRKRQGIGMGVWWSTVLLLGHKGIMPMSILGRIVAACGMLASIMLLSLLTGVIASALTVQQLDSGISHPDDLHSVRVVTVESSTSADYLSRRRISFQTTATPQEAMQMIADGRADAVVYDRALIRYLTNREFAETVQVLPVSFNTQEYAIALPLDSELRKPLNEALLEYRAGDRWDDLIYRYLGE